MGLEKFQILFDNPYGVYYGGQGISGRVFIAVNSAKKIRAITVKLKGEAEVKWEEEKRHTSNTSGPNLSTLANSANLNTLANSANLNNLLDPSNSDVYSNEEVYFENKVTVFGGGNDMTLPPGEHSFPFSYVLPRNIPSSFEGEYGHVRYTVRAVVDRPWKFDHECKVAFTVICPVDLNADPKLAEPMQLSKEKNFCCLCCASAPLSAVLSLPSGGAVPGETILPSVEVDNGSNVHIGQVKIAFVKSVTYKARNTTKVAEVNILDKHLGYVDAHSSRSWARDPLIVPALPPSDLTNCNIIDLHYYVRADIIPAGWHQRVIMNLPVILGTIPFHQKFGDFTSANTQPPLGWNLAPSAPLRDGSPNYPGLRSESKIQKKRKTVHFDLRAPPKFEQVVTGSQSTVERSDNEYVIGDKNYAPLYPVYAQQPPSQY